jgi:hypothetical protein
MSNALQIGLWGIAAVIPLGVNWWAHRLYKPRFTDALGLSLFMVLMWALYNVVVASPPGRPQNMIPLTFLDVAAMFVVLVAWASRHRAYKLILASLFLAQLVIHAAFWLATSWRGPAEHGMLYSYLACLNATFALQLLTVGFPGGRALVRRHLTVGLGYRGDRLHLGSGRR